MLSIDSARSDKISLELPVIQYLDTKMKQSFISKLGVHYSYIIKPAVKINFNPNSDLNFLSFKKNLEIRFLSQIIRFLAIFTFFG
jgi:hypothetical protein